MSHDLPTAAAVIVAATMFLGLLMCIAGGLNWWVTGFANDPKHPEVASYRRDAQLVFVVGLLIVAVSGLVLRS